MCRYYLPAIYFSWFCAYCHNVFGYRDTICFSVTRRFLPENHQEMYSSVRDCNKVYVLISLTCRTCSIENVGGASIHSIQCQTCTETNQEGELLPMMSNEGYRDRILTCRDC